MCGVCTDGVLPMLRSKSGYQLRVKKLGPQAKGTHCMIHLYALASKIIPASLKEVLESVIQIINCVKTQTLNCIKNYAKTLMLTTKSFFSTQQYVACRKEALLILSLK